ncbi:MAG: TonB-dependent receptor [Gemmatimonadetes bacterium]|nr:TonB-dependent receptor [Gemmatimonadota bacterium]
MKYHALFKWAFMTAGALALWVANAAPATAQQRGTLRGTVREASSQRPVAGVQVFVPGTRMSTTTDAQGRFELAGVPAGGAQVRVRAPGYSSALATTMIVGGEAVTVDFALNTSVIALDEVVVTGTGAAAERKQLGNTIATVRADVIETAPVKSFSEAIAAREPGVSLLPSSGMAGEGARVRIRGNASLSMNNEPVVYVDGVRIDAGSVGFQPTGQVSMLDNINPETIERVEILKGAAAATLYGSEASAGVIQIFTKKGTQGRPRFSFRIDQGGSRFPADRMKDNWGFARNQAQADRLNAIHRGTAVDANGNPVATIQPFQVVGFPNVSSKSTWATGYDASYSATVAGGGADAVYNLAVRFTRDNGPFDVSEVVGPFFIDQLPFEPGKIDFNRKWHGSGNVTLFPKDRVTLSAGFFFTDVQHQTPANANNIYGVTGATLFAKPETGNCARSIDRGLGGAFGEDPDRPGHCAGPGNPWGNVAFATVRENAFSEDQAHVDHFNANLRAGYTPVQGRLSMDLTLGVDITNSREHQFVPWGNNVDVFSTRVPLGHKSLQSRFNRELSVDYKANWTKSFGIFSSQLTVGGQGFISKAHFRSGFGGDFPGPGLEVAGAGARQSTGEFFSEIVNLGLMGQEQVGINEWWFITLGGRWDRNSAFGENTTGQFYPKVSTSIVVSDLPNWTSTTLSTLRFRGALGRSGLQPGAFDRFTTFGPSTSQLGAGLSPRNLGNPDLKPEVTTEWEAGVEVGLVDNRVALDVTRWERTTIDALVSRQFAVTGGFLAPGLLGEPVRQRGVPVPADRGHGWRTAHQGRGCLSALPQLAMGRAGARGVAGRASHPALRPDSAHEVPGTRPGAVRYQPRRCAGHARRARGVPVGPAQHRPLQLALGDRAVAGRQQRRRGFPQQLHGADVLAQQGQHQDPEGQGRERLRVLPDEGHARLDRRLRGGIHHPPQRPDQRAVRVPGGELLRQQPDGRVPEHEPADRAEQPAAGRTRGHLAQPGLHAGGAGGCGAGVRHSLQRADALRRDEPGGEGGLHPVAGGGHHLHRSGLVRPEARVQQHGLYPERPEPGAVHRLHRH